MNRIRTAKIGGRRWKIRWEPIDAEDKAVGLCYKSEHEIVIDSRIANRELLACIVHEVAHAADGAASEAEVERMENAITDALWRIGYRCA